MTPHRHACIVTGGDNEEEGSQIVTKTTAKIRDTYKRVADRCDWWVGA